MGLPAPGTGQSSTSSAAGRIHTGSLSSFSWVAPGAIIILPSGASRHRTGRFSPVKVFPRRKRSSRTRSREFTTILSAGNYEELGDLYMDDGKFAAARAAFDKAIGGPRPIRPIPFTGAEFARSSWETPLAPRLPDMEEWSAKSPLRFPGVPLSLLAHAYARTGQKEKPRRSSGR